MKVVCKGIELGELDPVCPIEGVVGEHGRDCHEQARGGHDQGFADRASDPVQRRCARNRDAHQRVIDAPYGAEKPDEGRGRADRSEGREPALESCGAARDRLTQRACEELAAFERSAQCLRPAIVEVRDREVGVMCQFVERGAGRTRGEDVQSVRQPGSEPEGIDRGRPASLAQQAQTLAHDEIPAAQRHEQQQHRHSVADCVALSPQAAEAKIGVVRHFQFSSLKMMGT